MAKAQPPSTIAQVRDVFPKLGELSDKVLFGDVWERKGLSNENGVTRDEICELITHLAFYAGWPNAGTAALIAKQVFEERNA